MKDRRLPHPPVPALAEDLDDGTRRPDEGEIAWIRPTRPRRAPARPTPRSAT